MLCGYVSSVTMTVPLWDGKGVDKGESHGSECQSSAGSLSTFPLTFSVKLKFCLKNLLKDTETLNQGKINAFVKSSCNYFLCLIERKSPPCFSENTYFSNIT